MAEKNNDYWVGYLSQIELPVLGETLSEISKLTECELSTISQLAEVILKDADLTSKVIRLSNTVFYNHSHRHVSTVSRAITLIGFETVKSIAISSLVIDAFISKNPRTHLQKALARALHAAIQARNLLCKPDSLHREEVFIAALLSHIGELAFWSCRAEQAEELGHKMLQMPPREAQREVLGTSFQMVTQGLVANWKLGELLASVVSSNRPETNLIAAIRTVTELAQSAENGWNSKNALALEKKLASQMSLEQKELRKLLEANADETVKLATAYGLGRLCRHLPVSGKQPQDVLEEVSALDPVLQLQVLRDLSEMLSEKPNLNIILQTVVEGLHRAVGLPRVALLLVGPDRMKLVPRIVLGNLTHHWKTEFTIDLSEQGLLTAMVEKPPRGLLDNPQSAPWRGYPRPAFDRWIGQVPAMYSGLFFNDRLIGFIYADYADLISSQINEQYGAFSHFTQQAQLCLNQLSE